VRQLADGVSVRIQYYDNTTSELATLAFNVNR
jgi:hypothetical protein